MGKLKPKPITTPKPRPYRKNMINIEIDRDLKENLKEIGFKGQRYSDIIRMLYDYYMEKHKLEP